MNDDHSILGLATIRRNRGISLDQISETTKISKRCLQAIEGGDFGKLPGGIYNTSYIRQYARAIDFDEGQLLEYYHSQSGDDGVSQSPARENGKNIFGGFRPASTLFGS